MRRLALVLAVLALGATPAAAAAAPREPARLVPDPLAVVRAPATLAGSSRRMVVVRPDRVELRLGARVLASAPFPGRAGTLQGLAAVLARSPQRDWLRQVQPGVFLLRAALTQAPGSVLSVAAPGVRELRLADEPGVYVSALGAVGRFTGVVVTSWHQATGRPTTNPHAARPFVLYGPGSTLEVVRSRFAYLGTDRWQGAGGVTWDGATGKALGSVFHHNLSGASASAGRRVRFVANVVRDNAAHGLDAHGASSSLLVQGNRAFRNGRSGIALAAAADAIVRANNAFANGADGIVAADGSDHGVLTGNVVERNRGDGIVVLGSSDVLVHGNLVRGNHVGVRVSQHSADDRVEANQVIGNERGIELAGGARDVALAGNLVAGSAVLGIELRAPASVSHGDHVEGGQVGVEVDSLARLDGTTVRAVRRGILVTARGIAELRQVRVTAAKAGVEVASGGLVRVEGSRLAAPEPFAGAAPRAEHGNALVSRNALLPSLAVASALMLVVALMLRLLQRARYRPAPERKEPQGAWYAS